MVPYWNAGGALGYPSVLIESRNLPDRGWPGDVVRILGHVRVVTSGESEALRAAQVLQADLAMIDCFGLTEDEHAALIASLESLSAEQSLRVSCIVGPEWRYIQGKEGVNPHCEAIHLHWPIAPGASQAGYRPVTSPRCNRHTPNVTASRMRQMLQYDTTGVTSRINLK